jgi:hypothetical protein
MAFDFPSHPFEGQIFIEGPGYMYSAGAWRTLREAPVSTMVKLMPPQLTPPPVEETAPPSRINQLLAELAAEVERVKSHDDV